MPKVNDLTGLKFGKLFVVKQSDKKNGKTAWLCKCDCGNEKVILATNLVRGLTKSCGCISKELAKAKTNYHIGERFGRLVVESFDYKKGNNNYLICKCDCGNKKSICQTNLINGSTKSCGCVNREIASKRIIEVLNKRNYELRGNRNISRIYNILDRMKTRCYNTNSKAYNDYGGRGIKICNEWLESNKNFYDWAINNGYKDGLTIERINVDGNYEPNNCKWITRSEQNLNKRNSLIIEYNGEKVCFSDFCHKYNIPLASAYHYYHKYNIHPKNLLESEKYNERKHKKN